MIEAAAKELPDTRERRLWVAEVERVRAATTGLTPGQIEAVMKVLASVADSGDCESVQTRLDAARLLADVTSSRAA
jgi:hypothetical protein